ncbi:MAG TPA: hypothetical protein VF897_04630 [Roseiflexaceae bacterium]
MREGQEVSRHPGMGVYALCLGPNSSLPGERLRLVIYDHDDQVVRRLEQKRGRCIDEGWVSFFANDPRSRPARFLWPIVDIDAAGVETVLIADYRPDMGMEPYYRVLAEWVASYGVPDATNESV